MKKKFLLSWLFPLFCFGAIGENFVWGNGYTFLNFLQDYHVPTSLYYKLSSEDKELTAEIYAGVEYQTLKDKNGKLLQALIPIGEDIQIHIYQENFQYKMNFIPIKYFQKNKKLALAIQKSPHQDIFEQTKDLGLANDFLNTYKKSINFKRDVLKNDRLAILYVRKYRFGKPFGVPNIKATMIETNAKANYLISYNDSRYYNLEGKEIAGFLLQMPLSKVYITSKFSQARRHPVKRELVRPHFGLDMRARIGTQVKSAGAGKIVHAGRKGGYGKTVEILHEGGLKTLYAHLDSINKNIRVGTYVKQGQPIAKSGNTGISSGPHLHFGLYKNGRPINPLGSIKTTRSELKGKKKDDFLLLAKYYQTQLLEELNKLSQTQTSTQEESILTQNPDIQEAQ